MNRTNQYSISEKINLIFDKTIKPNEIIHELYYATYASP